LPPWKFILLDGLAALISVPLWIYVGHLFGSNLEELEVKIRQFQFGVYLILGVIVLAFVGAAIIKRRALKNLPTED
jgi:membrane protein DedA with SNARE-associated domain